MLWRGVRVPGRWGVLAGPSCGACWLGRGVGLGGGGAEQMERGAVAGFALEDGDEELTGFLVKAGLVVFDTGEECPG